MASFIRANELELTPRLLLDGEFGIVGIAGNLLTSLTSITATDQTKITVAGAVSSGLEFGISALGGGLTSIDIAQGGTVSGATVGIFANKNPADLNGRILVQNSGTIASPGGTGVNIAGSGDTRIFNSGEIRGFNGAVGATANNFASVINSGTITTAQGFGLLFNGSGSTQTINSGTIQSLMPDGIAFAGSGAANVVVNTGSIIGGIALGNSDDQFNGIDGEQDYIEAYNGDDRIYGGASDELIFGGAGNDTIFGNDGRGVLNGDAGNDILRGGKDADRINGGSDTDWVYYNQSDAGIEIDLATGFGFGGHAEGDTVTNVERVLGSAFADEINGNVANNYLIGGAGNDIMRGANGNDILRGDGGADVMNGGSGADWLYYGASNAGVVINLTLGTASGGHAQGDRFFSIENVNGSRYGDQLTGSTGDNQLLGFEGNDIIRGYFGNDGLNGGGGADRFVFEPGSDKDFISDFTNDVDKLDLRAFGFSSAGQVLSNASVSGNDVFIDLGAGDQIRLVGFAPNFGDLADDLIL